MVFTSTYETGKFMHTLLINEIPITSKLGHQSILAYLSPFVYIQYMLSAYLFEIMLRCEVGIIPSLIILVHC